MRHRRRGGEPSGDDRTICQMTDVRRLISESKTPGARPGDYGNNSLAVRPPLPPRQDTLRFSADALPRLVTSSYSTVCPSLSVLRPARSTAEIWTNTSLSPAEGRMHPEPLVGLK